MRILFLSPGTGSFYCGSCMRDNALAIALRKRGHDAMLVPLYLAPTLDEESAAENAPLFYGGINVYLQQASPIFRHTPRWIDRMFDSPGALQAAAGRAGMTQARDLGALTVSTLRGEDGNQVKELERLTDWVAREGKPDVVCLSNALLLGLARRIKRATGAVVACTLQGEDTFLDALTEPYRTQAWNTLSERARDVDALIAVSRYHADIMTRRAKLIPDKVHVIYNGILLDGYGPKPPLTAGQKPVLGYLARMYAPKGLTTLVDAYILLRERGRINHLQLHVAGAQTAADVPYVAQLQAKLDAAGYGRDVAFLPNLDRKEKVAFLRGLSVLSVPATYGESFGLYVLEALAAGVPVVQPRHAVFPELLEQTGGGVLCEPNDPAALADAVENLLRDPTAALALGEAGRRTVNERFSVETMAQHVEQVFVTANPKRETSTIYSGISGKDGE
ncbi:MAG: glycosyltransferase family 4 protein [Capsulimonadales bacterium]|nr:glycosyltransferase family 4 protein [Capsulimonadales bacterium]